MVAHRLIGYTFPRATVCFMDTRNMNCMLRECTIHVPGVSKIYLGLRRSINNHMANPFVKDEVSGEVSFTISVYMAEAFKTEDGTSSYYCNL